MGGMISLSVWLYLFGDDAARTAKREDQGGALPNSRRVGTHPSNCLLCAVHERTPISMDDLQSIVLALARLGCSRRHSRDDGRNIIASQRRRQFGRASCREKVC